MVFLRAKTLGVVGSSYGVPYMVKGDRCASASPQPHTDCNLRVYVEGAMRIPNMVDSEWLCFLLRTTTVDVIGISYGRVIGIQTNGDGE